MGTKGKSNLYGRGKRGQANKNISYKYSKMFLHKGFKKHYEVHGKNEMGLTEDQYRSMGISFSNKVDRINHESFTNEKGLTFKYSHKTNEIVLVTKEGEIATYFITNKKNWERIRRNNEIRR